MLVSIPVAQRDGKKGEYKMNFFTLTLAAVAALALPSSSNQTQSQNAVRQITQDRPLASYEAVTANYSYDTESSFDTVGNTRLIYESGVDDAEGAACWFYPETYELALSGTVGNTGKVTFDKAPDLRRCPTMD